MSSHAPGSAGLKVDRVPILRAVRLGGPRVGKVAASKVARAVGLSGLDANQVAVSFPQRDSDRDLNLG